MMQRKQVSLFVTAATVISMVVLTYFSDQTTRVLSTAELQEESPSSQVRVEQTLGTSTLLPTSTNDYTKPSHVFRNNDETLNGISNLSEFSREKSDTKSEESIGQVVRARAEHLLQECQRSEVKQLAPYRPWTIEKHTLTRPFPVCVAPKGGSITWRYLLEKLRKINNGSRKDLKTLVVRHPLARLASVYRDKYLNGLPLNQYNRTFTRVTGSGQTWRDRWQEYWLPTLINKGLVKASPKYLKTIQEASEAFKYIAKTSINSAGKISLSAPFRIKSNYHPKILSLAKRMLEQGRHLGVIAAVNDGYSIEEQNNLKKQFINFSFTMEDFLHHLLWTWDKGLVDRHWTPISELCNPCGGDYKYVVHLENPDEANYVLGLLLENNTLPWKHRSIGVTTNNTNRSFFANIPKKLIDRIVNIYILEFKLFGYHENSF
ncbi:uncharacterized protein LOC121859523 [Homarus americanus]|uniref:uncharacterized protein LOC121859523 n=1 Tax=Homarus americanus TaxID=6706 RepID=UPI001C477955|nr:uncharacterized protein LOC121859523 [Homarus americanus]